MVCLASDFVRHQTVTTERDHQDEIAPRSAIITAPDVSRTGNDGSEMSVVPTKINVIRQGVVMIAAELLRRLFSTASLILSCDIQDQ
ncbi:unnamed protein product [Gongylonema pulchrum]|uniref:Uncharacterized protein n=1 Tax=Gongylonema pulchrum TaxID=637853 RepID=A0A3P7Q2M1_9BILA|nr:unnamed protein product [Gongylonema pulchrum]